MRKEFSEYLMSIGITKPLYNKIETVYEFFREICPDEITGIFVTDYITEDGTREYEHLCFFSERFFMDAKLFITKDDLSINPIKKRLYYLNIQKKDYDFMRNGTNATEKSRLLLKFYIDVSAGVVVTLKASKENCDYIRDMVFKYITPNLME